MHTNPTKLREQRQDILDQMARIPRLKRGILSERKRRSASTGQPCASQFIFQRWENGRNKAQHVPTEDLPKVRSAVDGFQLFNQLADQFVQVSEALTELEAPVLPGKKKLAQAAQEARFRETENFLQLASASLRENGAGDIGWLERGLRAALLADGRELLSSLLNDPALLVHGDVAQPGETAHAGRKRRVISLLGPMVLRRRYYHHPMRHTGRCPLDDALGLIGELTPGLAQIGARAAAQGAFASASADLVAYAGVPVSGRQLQRLSDVVAPQMREDLRRRPVPANQPTVPILYIEVDGTGVPMRPSELKDTKGRGPEGQATTRELKLACLFTQSHTDEKNNPLRDDASTTYLSSFATATDFGPLVRQEAFRRGYAQALTTIVLGDGAAWIDELARLNFPDAVRILDFYHASEHLAALERVLLPSIPTDQAANTPIKPTRYERWRQWLLDSRLTEILSEAHAHLSAAPDQLKEAQAQIAYLQNHHPFMNYAQYRRRGWFIGSGAVESGCKLIVGQRCKHSGMHWTIPGARNILTMRSALHSQDQFDLWWASRQNRRSA